MLKSSGPRRRRLRTIFSGSAHGEVILRRDPSALAQAETCFRKAIQVARSRSGKWWELRATVSLARLLRNNDRRNEARSDARGNLQLIHRRLRHRGVKDAKALLDQLSA